MRCPEFWDSWDTSGWDKIRSWVNATSPYHCALLRGRRGPDGEGRPTSTARLTRRDLDADGASRGRRDGRHLGLVAPCPLSPQGAAVSQQRRRPGSWGRGRG